MGHLIDYGLTKAKSGAVQVALLFEFEGADGAKHQMPWFGSLKKSEDPNKRGGRDITLDTLAVLGFQASDLSVLADGLQSKALRTDVQVSLAVDERKDQEGKVQIQIKWVNPLGGGTFRNRISRQDAVREMQGMDIRADIARRNQGQQQRPQPIQQGGGGGWNGFAPPEDDMEVPF